jgi:hypothetical protein
MYAVCKYTHFFHNKTVGDGEKLITYLNSAFKVLLELDIFPRVPKKLNFVFQCNQWEHSKDTEQK